MIKFDDQAQAALLATRHAANAIGALADFGRVGVFGFEGDPVIALAEACRLAAQIEIDTDGTDLTAEDIAMAGQLAAACQRYIEHWRR